jgi:hypothetical protein
VGVPAVDLELGTGTDDIGIVEEEKETDEKLTQLSGRINIEAADSDESDRGSSQSRKAR